MDLIAEARRVLEKNGYSVIRSRDSDTTIYFEDENLMGFLWAASGVHDICIEWETRQDSFLKTNSQLLRKSDLKAWNLYAVFLATDEPSGEDRPTLVAIEEDFRAARKIARGGVSTSKDVLNALLPLVPIQSIVSVSREDTLLRLKERVSSVPPSAVEIVLRAENYSPSGAATILREYADKRNRD